jgi:multidrug efflux system membrane fusion protein
VLAKIDPRLFQAALDQANAKKSQDEAQLVSAQKDLVRFTTLAVKSFETQQNVDQQQAKVDGFKAAIAADKAAIESAQTQLDYTTITAPIGGRVGFRQVDVGNIVHASDTTPLVVLTQTQPATVIFTLPESFLDDVRDAMTRGPVEVTAYDQNNVRMLGTGKILLIDAIIDQATATIRLKALFPNADEKLWPGEFVNVRVLIDTQQNVIAIPASAVQRGPNGFYAWAITGGNKAEMRPLETGATTNDVTIVTSGVKEGDRLVIEGQYKLQPDSVVTITPPRSVAINTAADSAAADQR